MCFGVVLALAPAFDGGALNLSSCALLMASNEAARVQQLRRLGELAACAVRDRCDGFLSLQRPALLVCSQVVFALTTSVG